MATKRFLALVTAIVITFFLTFFLDRIFVLEQGATPGLAHVTARTDLGSRHPPGVIEPTT